MEKAQCVPETAVITGWDFSTGGVKCLAFSLEGKTLAEVRLPTDLWTAEGVSELNVMQLEGQARASTRAMAAQLQELGRLQDWVAGGISATHHTSARIDRNRNQVRRAICWNDQSLGQFQAAGVERLGGQNQATKLTGGPWAIRYSLSHLVKDEAHLSQGDWERTWRILSHGSLAAGFLTGVFDRTSVSCAASTGIMDLRTSSWKKEMLSAVNNPKLRELAWKQLPAITSSNEPLGLLSLELALEAGIPLTSRPMLFPTADDQQAGLAGGGASEPGQIAIILGNSAVVNSSSGSLPSGGSLDVMRLNWGPYLWMRCYNNGAQFLDRVVGSNPDWNELENQARQTSPGCAGTVVLPFPNPEPSLGIHQPRMQWLPKEPDRPGEKFRAALEALAYLMSLGVKAHEEAGQKVSRITVSGGIARSQLMCEILASVLNRPLARLESFEGPALGAAVEAFANLENHLRKQKGIAQFFSMADAMAQMIRFKDEVKPNPAWSGVYATGLQEFSTRLGL
ncbi:MAG: xylulose kinase [Gemmataceae bacterium]|nr:xylulose kinase [Gemmataceae bacterium]